MPRTRRSFLLKQIANYILTLRKELIRLSRACGVPHPALVTAGQFEILDSRYGATTARALFGYPEGLGLPAPTDQQAIRQLMTAGLAVA